MVSGVGEHGRQIDSLRLSFDELRAESHEGTAIAIALGGMQIPYSKDAAFSLRLGHYRSGFAISAAGAFRLSAGSFFLPEDVSTVVDLGIAQGLDYSQTGSTAGITWSW